MVISVGAVARCRKNQDILNIFKAQDCRATKQELLQLELAGFAHDLGQSFLTTPVTLQHTLRCHTRTNFCFQVVMVSESANSVTTQDVNIDMHPTCTSGTHFCAIVICCV